VSLNPVTIPSTPANKAPHTAIFCNFILFPSLRADLILLVFLNHKSCVYQIFRVWADHNFELSGLNRKAHLAIPERQIVSGD